MIMSNKTSEMVDLLSILDLMGDVCIYKKWLKANNIKFSYKKYKTADGIRRGLLVDKVDLLRSLELARVWCKENKLVCFKEAEKLKEAYERIEAKLRGGKTNEKFLLKDILQTKTEMSAFMRLANKIKLKTERTQGTRNNNSFFLVDLKSIIKARNEMLKILNATPYARNVKRSLAETEKLLTKWLQKGGYDTKC